MPPCPQRPGGVPDGGHLPYVRNQALPSLPADRTRDSVSMVIVNRERGRAGLQTHLRVLAPAQNACVFLYSPYLKH